MVTVQPCEGTLFLQKQGEHAIQIRKIRSQIYFSKPILSAVFLEDSKQDFLRLLKVFSGPYEVEESACGHNLSLGHQKWRYYSMLIKSSILIFPASSFTGLELDVATSQ